MEAKRILAHRRDEWGVIQAVEVDGVRYLDFGLQSEQGCTRCGEPLWLDYDYNRALLLGALNHPAPKTALFLGLGAGSLTQCVMQALPSLERIDVIELRPAVLELAQQFFGYAPDERVHHHLGDALALLAEMPPADLIFMDMYLESGPAEGHLAWSFLHACREKLNPHGWLLINQWSDELQKPLGAALLQGVFHGQYWECPVIEGNVALWVPAANAPVLQTNLLEQAAWRLSSILGYDVGELLDGLRRPE